MAEGHFTGPQRENVEPPDVETTGGPLKLDEVVQGLIFHIIQSLRSQFSLSLDSSSSSSLQSQSS